MPRRQHRSAKVKVNGDLRQKARQASGLLRNLAHAHRLLIVCALANGERSVTEIEHDIGVGQPRLSQQLAELRKAGIIANRRDAQSVYYHVVDDRAGRIAGVLYEMFCAPRGRR
jgi:DNA-binding transcriptional ArsR family regulator